MTEVAAALEIGTALWRAAEDLKFRERIADIFKRRETIIVLGPSGCGKTNLIVSLNAAAGFVDPIPKATRTETTERRRVRVNDRPFRVIDTPGQAYHEADRLRAVREVSTRQDVRIINVAAFGYHEYGRNPSEAVDANNRAREDYLTAHREQELRALQEWLPILGDRSITKWILTVISKADIWWDDQERVLEHYRSGQYATHIQRQDPKMRHVVMPYCSVAQKFYGRVPLSGNFDDSTRMTIDKHFLRQLVALG